MRTLRSFRSTRVSVVFSSCVAVMLWWFSAAVNADAAPLKPESWHKNTSQMITGILRQNHYVRSLKFNDELSNKVLDQYLNSLDASRIYFIQADIERFDGYRTQLDESLQRGDLQIPYQIFNVFLQRWNERYDFALAYVQKPITFDSKERLEFDREKSPWPKDSATANELWRLRIKNDALNLKLAKKNPDEIKSLLTKRYEMAKRRMNQSNSEDVFSYYMNAFATTFDPHTNYMSPRQAEAFDIEMKLSLEGIGAVLQSDDVYTKVVSVVPMGPADRSKQINPEDKIVGVAQGDAAFEDVIGWRLDDVVAKIKGKAGSVVRLEVLPKANAADGKTKIVSITREKVKLEDQAAKSSLKVIEEGGRKYTIGVIDVPKFYVDFQARAMGDENYKSVARDVRDLITKLKTQKVEGIVLDLRNNGGGGLDEAAMMTGLFIDHGPVVQERDAVGSISLVDDDEPGVTWSGPLAVLVNGQSASASEIVAAALQDYGRAVIIGEPTFGKGTVQQMFDLNRLRDNNAETLGQIKYTLQKFYRVTGQSTQHRGVLPDIALPTIYDQADFGEGSLPNALPWDFVPRTKFTPVQQVQKWVPQLKSWHEKRVAKDVEYQYVVADVNEYNQRKKDKTISLNEQERKAEREKANSKELTRENERRARKGLPALKALPENELAADEAQDVRLDATARIVADMVKLHANKRLVANGK